VLVFFDARHPEPGAMGDTLKHLVENTVQRPDATKFLYILNQIDNTAREDNPEEVVAAWQRALAQHGLTAGRFYRIYARDAALTVDDDEVRSRMERKRDEDLADIEARIRQVEVERAYRVVGVLEKTARRISDVLIPRLAEARRQWRRRTLWMSIPLFLLLVVGFLWWSISGKHWDGLALAPFAALEPPVQGAVVAGVILLLWFLHSKLRSLAAASVLRKLERDNSLGRDGAALRHAFAWNSSAWWQSITSSNPRGWGRLRQRQLDTVLAEADSFVQSLNDQYASPSGTPE
jgi:hypothetical protein